MGIFDAVRERIERRAARNSIRELRKLREVLEIGIDSYREANGLPKYFVKAIEEAPPEFESFSRGGVIRPGEYQMIWMIEELAREFRVPITAETDLEALALERGWVSADGRLLMVPQAAAGQEIEL